MQTEATTEGENVEQVTAKILLGVAGSVAAVKAPELAVSLCRNHKAHVKVLLTRGARNFWDQSKTYSEHWWNELHETNDSEGSNGSVPRIDILHSEDEWRSWNQLGDSVMHIELRDWADCLVLAPLSAHTLAKLANGLCDDALSSVARAWDFRKPMVLAPAMNTNMWEHPLTQQQLETIQGFFHARSTNNQQQLVHSLCYIVKPQVKTLACGQVGDGALAPVVNIVDAVKTAMDRELLQANTRTTSYPKYPPHLPPQPYPYPYPQQYHYQQQHYPPPPPPHFAHYGAPPTIQHPFPVPQPYQNGSGWEPSAVEGPPSVSEPPSHD